VIELKVIEVDSVTVKFNGRTALERVTFDIVTPKVFCIVGPNGAGKTTLLRTILGLIKPVEGHTRVLGHDPLKEPKEVRKLVGYVPQRASLNLEVPILVKDIVLMGRTVKRGIGAFSKRDYDAAKEALKIVGLLELWSEPFRHLSGGQQQRVLLARALSVEPTILMLDEPFAGVDSISRTLIMDTLRKMSKQGVTVILVSHDINDVLEIADEVMLLNKRVLAIGEPEKVLKYYLSRAISKR